MASTIWDDLPGTLLNFNQPFNELYKQVLALPKGTIRRYSGEVVGISIEMESETPLRFKHVPLRTVENCGEPGDELIYKALCYLDARKGDPVAVIKISTQAELLVFAQACTKFGVNEPRYAMSEETEKRLALRREVYF